MRKWSVLLTRPIPMSDGRLLRTLADARVLTQAKKRARFRDPWSRAEPLIEQAAETGAADDIDRVTGQLEMVLLGAQMLKL